MSETAIYTAIARRFITGIVAGASVIAALTACTAAAPNDASSASTGDAGASATPNASGDGFCEVLRSDTTTAATVFAAPIWDSSGKVDQANLAARIQLLDKLDSAPDGLDDDLEIWKGFVNSLTAVETPADVFAAQTDEVDAARDALFDEYVTNCL